MKVTRPYRQKAKTGEMVKIVDTDPKMKPIINPKGVEIKVSEGSYDWLLERGYTAPKTKK